MDSNDVALSVAIIMMAHKLGLKVIAEGVETVGQKKILVETGCYFARGFLYSMPVSPGDLESILHNQQVNILHN